MKQASVDVFWLKIFFGCTNLTRLKESGTYGVTKPALKSLLASAPVSLIRPSVGPATGGLRLGLFALEPRVLALA